MSIDIITQFKTKPGQADDLIALIRRALPESLRHDGCIAVHIRQNQDDANDVISVQEWTSRRHYETYRAWRKKNGVTAAIETFLTQPISVRYFDEVSMPAPTSVQPVSVNQSIQSGATTARVDARPSEAPEVPKVGSEDALGG